MKIIFVSPIMSAFGLFLLNHYFNIGFTFDNWVNGIAICFGIVVLAALFGGE